MLALRADVVEVPEQRSPTFMLFRNCGRPAPVHEVSRRLMISGLTIQVCEFTHSEFARGQLHTSCIPQDVRQEMFFPLLPLLDTNEDTRIASPLVLTASFFFRADRLADLDEQKFSNIQSNPQIFSLPHG